MTPAIDKVASKNRSTALLQVNPFTHPLSNIKSAWVVFLLDHVTIIFQVQTKLITIVVTERDEDDTFI